MLWWVIYGLVEEECGCIVEVFGECFDEFMWFKVEGVLDCVELLVVVLMDDCECYVFGCWILL